MVPEREPCCKRPENADKVFCGLDMKRRRTSFFVMIWKFRDRLGIDGKEAKFFATKVPLLVFGMSWI